MEDRQVLVRHSVAIQQNVFGTTPPGFTEDNLEVPRDVDDGIFRRIDKPTVSGSAPAQLAGDAMTGIAERALVKLLVEPGPCLGRQVAAGNIKKLAHHGAAPGAPSAALIEVGWQSAG